MKVCIIGEGSIGIASHISHSSTIQDKLVVVDNNEEEQERGIEILPKIVQNIIEDMKTTNAYSCEYLSGREKRRERRKKERKNK